MSKETWVTIKDHEQFEISDWGRVRSKLKPDKAIKGAIHNGVREVSLRGMRVQVNTLVMKHFGNGQYNRKKRIHSKTGSNCIWDLYYKS